MISEHPACKITLEQWNALLKFLSTAKYVPAFDKRKNEYVLSAEVKHENQVLYEKREILTRMEYSWVDLLIESQIPRIIRYLNK